MSTNDGWDTRERLFHALVLTGIWIIVKMIANGKSGNTRADANMWASEAARYQDKWGRPGDEPREYRRTHTFKDLGPSQ